MTAEDIAEFYQWRKLSQKAKGDSDRGNPLSGNKVTVWQLRRLGWTIEQVGQMLGVSTRTITRWDKVVRKEFADLPSTRIAIDAIQGLIPKAYQAYHDALTCDDNRLRKEAAKDILTHFKVLTDKPEEGNEDRNRSDGQLIAEAERVIAQTTAAAGSD